MRSASGRFVISFNGEIYNHLELRTTLNSHFSSWRSHSDTETLLEAVEIWGVESTLKSTVGMFAFALWDNAEKVLYLARDRFGEKPLYYGLAKGTFAFASELKALKAFPQFPWQVDRRAIGLLLRHSYIPAPFSIYEGISKLPAGTWVGITEADLRQMRLPSPRSYWSATEASLSGVQNPLSFTSDDEATTALEAEMQQAVRAQMLSDVPLGAFLSGGIDSSTIVALMQMSSNVPVKTFSIGFRETGYDEAQFAGAVARHLGTEHTELYVSQADALSVIPSLPTIFDEPFSDSSQIPTYLVSRLARKRVTVSLSGDGGDELFGGYNRYFLAQRVWKRLAKLPDSARRVAASVFEALPASAWAGLYQAISPVIPASRRITSPKDKLVKGLPLLAIKDEGMFYRAFMSHWEPDEVVIGAQEPETAFSQAAPRGMTFLEQMMLLDATTYLPDDILVKVDRAAMAVSLETRVPLLDHRLFEFAWRLPLRYKVRGGVGKWLLRQVLHRHVPKQLVDRPKMGFGVPVDVWLRGSLREWAEDLLSESRLKRQGYLRPEPIRKKWLEHVSGAGRWHYYLWDVLMFQAWLDCQ
jgi:asparagine synthase (glutamine-hydrolysing)